MAEPAWLTSLSDQRLALMEHALGSATADDEAILVTPLTEPDEGASNLELEFWDRRCDACGTYCAPSVDFYTGHLSRKLSSGQLVLMFFGVCPVHKFTTE